ncbi:MAG: dockerin type I domain-containing protein [Fibrobacteria bacterium]
MVLSRIPLGKLTLLTLFGCMHSWANGFAAADSQSFRAVMDLKPLAYWNFNDSSGDTLRDASGNGHAGFIKGAKYAKGVEGGALALDGHSWIEIPSDSGLRAESFTFSILIWQSGNGLQAPLMEFHRPNAQAGAHLWANTSGWGQNLPGAFYCNLRPFDPLHPEVSSASNEHLIYTAGGSSQGARWNHVVLTYDQAHGTANIYVNGKLQASQAWAPFIPNLAGTLLLGMRALNTLDNEKGLGLVGTLDDCALFGRALSGPEVASLYGRPAADPSGLHFGIKTHYAKASDTLWVPVFMTSEGKDSLSSLQFNLELDSTVAELLDVKPDTTLARGWQLAVWNGLSKSRIALALAGTRRISGSVEGEILRLKIRVLPTANTGASTMLILSDLSVDEGRVKAVSNLPGRVFVLPHDALLGDVNGDGLVDLKDAALLIRYVVDPFTLPNDEYPHFNLAAADVTGNGEISSYDAALVLQYGLGIIEDFPVHKSVLAKRAAPLAGLTLEGPIPLSGNRYHYRILGSNLDGLIGGRLTLDIGRNIQAISQVATGAVGARAAYGYDAQSGSLQIGMIANRKVRIGSILLAEWDAEYAAGEIPGEIKLTGASLNEGGLSVSGLTAGLGNHKPVPEKAGILRWFMLAGDRMRISVPGERIASVTLLDAKGRNILTRAAVEAISTMEIEVAGLWEGRKVLRVKTDKGRIHSAILGP